MSSAKKVKVPGTKPNYLYSIIGVTLVLVMLGFFGMMMIQAQEIMRFMKEKVEVVVELKNDISQQNRDKFIRDISSQAFVKNGSVKFLSKEEGATMLQEEFGEEFLKLDMPNPLFDVVTFNINSSYLKDNTISGLIKPFKESFVVRDIYFQENIAVMISQNLKQIGWVFLFIGLFLLFIAIFLIHNTIRLALYSNRFLIKNMELVGASWEFISQPYIKKSAIHGFISGVCAVLALAGILLFIQSDIPEIKEVTNYQSLIFLMVILIVLGIVISAGSTFYVVNKYLRMRVDEMY